MSSLEECRQQIDDIDKQLMQLLEQRFEVVRKLPPYKKNITDSQREHEILAKTTSPYIKDVYKTIFRNAKEILHESL